MMDVGAGDRTSAHGFSPLTQVGGGLAVETGQDSQAGTKDRNDDCVGLFVPEEPSLLALKGVSLVLCDGVSAAEAGGKAADTCVRGFLADYFATPDSWSVETSAQTVLTSLNRFLVGQSQSYRDPQRGYLCTLSALVLKSRTAHIFHIGDSRIYRARAGQIEQLTTDHKLRINAQTSYLARAMGLDLTAAVDHRKVAVEVGDVFILTSDGLHDFVDDAALLTAAGGPDLEAAAHKLIETALSNGSDDNLSAQLCRVAALPEGNQADLHLALSSLPLAPDLDPGMTIDGYRVLRRIHESPRSQLYVVEDSETGETLALKAPSVNYEDDAAYLERFVMEPWIGRRVNSRHVIASVTPRRRQTFLYHLLEFVDGITLAEWMQQQETRDVGEVTRIVDQIGRGLLALHRREIVHRDLKPDNVMIDREGRVRIIDLGGCFVTGVDEVMHDARPDDFAGTRSYGAPELRTTETPRPAADQYALAALTYELLTGRLPYGEEGDDEYVPAYQHNPLVPIWLSGALRKGLRQDPNARYGELTELLHDIAHPNPTYLNERAVPLFERNPIAVWRTIAVLMMVLELLTIYYFVELRP